MTPEVFLLTVTDRQSAVWRKIFHKLTEDLDELRVKNDASLSEFETAKLRGQIATIKSILDWDVDRTPEIKYRLTRHNGLME